MPALTPETNPKTLRDLRRGQILTVGRSLVAEGGLEALTIGALEKRCDFSRGVITYHFKNKDEIVEAVLRSAVDEIQGAARDRVVGEAEAAARIRTMLRAILEGFLEQREAAHILLAFWGRIPKDPRVTRTNAELYRGFRDNSAAVIEAGVRSGDFRADLDVPAFATLCVGVITGIVTQAYAEPGAIEPRAAIDLAADSLLAQMLA